MATAELVHIPIGDLTLVDAPTAAPVRLTEWRGVHVVVLLRHRH